MEALKLQNQKLTYEEYLILESDNNTRYEFYYGDVMAMAGTSVKHNDILGNLIVIFKSLLKGKPCKVNFESVKLEIKENAHYVYPDILVSCDKTDNDLQIIKFPVLIIEILSDSTEQFDRFDKFKAYQQIPSLKHYMLVHQKAKSLEFYTKKDDIWAISVFFNPDDVIEIEALNIKISIKEIYENIVYEEVKKKIIEEKTSE